MQSRAAVWSHIPGIAFVQGNFMGLKFVTRFDLVICNQVIEHLPDSLVPQFVAKLARHTAGTLIVSTTHMLKFGVIKGHVQDPISEAEFRSWFAPLAQQGTLEVLFCKGGPRGHTSKKANIIGVWTRR